MKIYLDNSVLNRPFDDQRQPRIWLETLAFSVVLQLIEAGGAQLIRSPVHVLENEQSPLTIRRHWVDRCLQLAQHESPWDEAVRTRANELEGLGFKPLDALHLAAAERAEATHFLTCDDRLLRRFTGRMKVLNPVDFVLLWSATEP